MASGSGSGRMRILFMAITMNVGGTEKALLNLIADIPREQAEVTVLLQKRTGGFLDAIPAHVRVETVEGFAEAEPLLEAPPLVSALSALTRGRILQAAQIACRHLVYKLNGDRTPMIRYIVDRCRPRADRYDLAVAYAGPEDFTTDYILRKVNAARKVQWIHFDVTRIGFSKRFAARHYPKFDQVSVVSEEAKAKLLEAVPAVKGNAVVERSNVPAAVVKSLAAQGEGFRDGFDGLRVLTVGRLTDEKGQDAAIRAASLLADAGLRFRWYCIGEGSARGRYEALIRSLGLEGRFVLLGADPNPYPYMAQCDIYVQPSRHEGFCITLSEAKCFHLPIVTTGFAGAREQIRDGETGLITGFSDHELALAVARLANDRHLRHRLSDNLQAEAAGHAGAATRLLGIVRAPQFSGEGQLYA